MVAKTRNLIALTVQAVVVVATVICVTRFFFVGGEGNMQVVGVTCFRYFTIDSNVLAALACAVCMVYEVRALLAAKRSGGEVAEPVLPHWVLILTFAGTVAVTLTFMVCICFLGPLYGYGFLFSGSNFFLHGLTPALCVFAFMALLRGPVRLAECFWCLLPVLLYGIVYFIMVIAIGPDAGGWPDFYAFNMGGMWPVTYVIIAVGTFVFAAIERLPHRRS